ncbi:hypothetical protein ACEPPN_014906 [Leptodophora sp. 'Broadleaf-Isolate-01']
MAQTPEQRKRNAKFTKEQDAKRGKPTQELKKKQEFKSPVSPVVLGTPPLADPATGRIGSMEGRILISGA